MTPGALSGALVLPADVLLVPVADLSAAARLQLNCQDGDVAITRPRLRTPSRLVSAGAAQLLREFATPATVPEAVIRCSRARGADPEATLEGAYPLLARMVREGFLVPASEANARRIEASWDEGDRIAGCTVQCCVQVLEDTEVYQVHCGGPRREAALKIERPAGGAEAVSTPASTPASARSAPVRRGIAARLEREAAILDHLARGSGGRGGRQVAPRLLAAGRWRERRFLLLEWCAGVEVLTAAAEARERGGEKSRAAVVALCGAVAGAYARLHRQGVLHCDVHPRNLLVSAEGGVRLVDFGLASWHGAPAGLAPAGRGGVAFYLEPEYAAAVLADKASPAASVAGEQYAVAALLYLLGAGVHYLDFSLERETMLRQIVERPPRPFAERGAGAWPELEAVLGRALAKVPADRYPSLDALAAALQAVPIAAAAAPAAVEKRRGAAGASHAAPVAQVADPDESRTAGTASSAAPQAPLALPSLAAALRRGGPAEELLAEVLGRLRPGGQLWEGGLPEPPFASVQFGAAGVALALYRIALARDDAELLSQADLWLARAASAAGGGGLAADPAFYNPRLDITAETVGRASLFHTAPGLRCTEALIANALDDRAGAARAAAAFVAAARQPCPNPDLTLGRSGLLLGCALLFDALDGAGGPETPPPAEAPFPKVAPQFPAPPPELPALGDELLAGLWRQIDRLPALSECLELPNLGMAHGWAGYLYATLRWCEAAGRSLPRGVAVRLDELAASAESWGRGARWRWHGQPVAEGHRRAAPAAARWMAGWCNGSAGMVHLWTLASRLPALSEPIDPGTVPVGRGCGGSDRWRQLAQAAAWHAWEAGDQVESLCCGLAGRAYALLALYQAGAGEEWLERARILANRAAANSAAERDAPDSPPHSLYRGQLGIAVLAADLERPAAAAMPLVGNEGWSVR